MNNLKVLLLLSLSFFIINITKAQSTKITLESGKYQIAVKSSGDVLDVTGLEIDDFAEIIEASFIGKPNQVFRVWVSPNQSYCSFTAQHVPNKRLSQSLTDNSVFYDQAKKESNFRFQLTERGNGYYSIKSLKNVDDNVDEVFTIVDGKLKTAKFIGTPNQLFKFIPIVDKVATMYKNWMSVIKDDTQLRKLSIPGTHDSGADNGCAKYLRAEIYARCQNSGIKDQLNNGIRYLDFRLQLQDEELAVYYGACDQAMNFVTVMNDVSSFLEENPSEAIFMRIRKSNEEDPNDKFKSRFESRTKEFESLFITRRTNTGAIELGDIRGKVLIINDCESGLSDDYYSYEDFDSPSDYYRYINSENPIEGRWTALEPRLSNDYLTSSINLQICGLNGTGLIMRDWYDERIDELIGVAKTPTEVATYTNKKCSDLINNNPYHAYGVIVMDFPSLTLISQIIRSNSRENVMKSEYISYRE